MAGILRGKGLLASQMGALGVGAAAVVTILMFLAIAAASATAEGSGVAGNVGVKALLTLVLIGGLILVARPLMARALRAIDNDRYFDSILPAMLAGALLTGLAADRIGVSALVGGFHCGCSSRI